MRFRIAVLVCLCAAGCGDQFANGGKGGGTIPLKNGPGHDSNKNHGPCTIPIGVDDSSISAPPVSVKCDKASEVVFVFANFGTMQHNLKISKTMLDKTASQSTDIFPSDVTSVVVAHGWDVQSQNMDPKNAQGGHTVKYTVTCDCTNTPLDPDIDIVM